MIGIHKQDEHLFEYLKRPATTRPAGRTSVTSHELRFMRQRLEGEPFHTTLHDIAVNGLRMLERAVEAEEKRRG